MRWQRLTRSLRHSNYRLYFFGQLVSLNGTWMQNVAQAWLVYRLTESSFMLGLVSFLSLAPVLVFGLFGGVIADRLPRLRLFLGAQVLACLQALTLGLLTVTGLVTVQWIMVLALLLGLVHAVEIPARHTLVALLVPREELHNAVALNSSTFNFARFLGPMLAGWLIALWGEGPVILLNALSFLAVILAILRIRTPVTPDELERRQEGVWEGLKFAWQRPELRYALMIVGAVSLFANPYLVLMPVFAREVFGGGSDLLGLLVGVAGLGALGGALRLAQREKGEGLERLIAGAGLLLGLGLMLFAYTPWIGVALLLVVLTGYAITTLVASTNTFLQLSAPDALRGRVMSLFSVIFIGLSPVGNLAAGALAEVLGVQFTVLLLGAVCLGFAVYYRGYLARRGEAG
ncbi:MFS transporter [Thiohalobacter thiocyanaticus]|uniref:MFS transporter n=1 Tax=Thiohalobacter thiocyanaticus TaxID=585455 RepID=A0A426QI28_9GAMM|nr:MFS transporter [Thiohalobacter thiocyanaticus]RRQ21412.1 MFS transporter [Thiohalobacter thiocyanaticus]